MKTVINNAFWREILDHLSSIILVFRIDEDERVHLIFVNNEVEKQLGFPPQDYVLASESAGLVSTELEELINMVADLSHKKGVENNFQYELTSRIGSSLLFSCSFKIFQTSSNRSNLIVLSLTPVIRQTAAGISTGSRENNPPSPPFFVAESEVMQALMDKVSEYVRQGVNVLVRGEAGSGRRTIALMMGHLSEGDSDISEYVNLEDKTDKEQQQLLFGRKDEREAEGGILNRNKDLILVINGFHEITRDSQEIMQIKLKERDSKGLKSKIIAISQNSIEDLIESDLFNTGLYYRLDFQPLLVPPLRYRGKDISTVAKEWLMRASETLKIEIKEIPEYELLKLNERDWKGNFTELFDMLRHSLLSIENGIITFSDFNKRIEAEEKQEREFALGGIVSFDEMTRKYLNEVLRVTGGKIYGKDGAAKLLHLKPTTLQSKLKKLGIK